MKNSFRLISYIIIVSLFIQNIALAASETVITDNDASWSMKWNWERNQEGFEFVSSQISTENGLKLFVDPQKYNEFVSYRYPSKDNGATKCEASGEYKYYIKLDESGNPVAYDSGIANARPVMVYHQNRDNYFAEFNVGETQNNGEPIVISYDFDTSNLDNANWSSPRMGVMGFTLRHNVNNMYQIVHSGGEKNIEKDSTRQKHSVTVVIAPTVTNGRYEMTAIMVDDVVTPLSGVYSTTSGKTDADCYLSKLDFTLRLAADRYAEITNLKVARGFDDMVVSTDFVDGAELGDGINILSSTQLPQNALSGKIKVYDCDFDGELIADPGAVVTYTDSGANVKFTKLESGGNYRMEITGITDVWGNEYSDTFSVSFATPQGESGSVDDTPSLDGGSSNISPGDIAIGSSNTNYHGHGFYTASKTDDTYEIVIRTEDWWNAEQSRTGRDNKFWYIDADGNEKLLGWGDDNWNKLDLEIAVGETINTGEPLVVSYDWYSENFGGLGEWTTNSMNVMGILCYLSDSNLSQTMFKYYKGGTTVAEKVDLPPSSDGWHNIKVVISPELTDGRCKIDAIILDGNITFFDNVYSSAKSDYTDDTFVLNKLGITIEKPRETSSGEGILKIRNIDIKRIDGLKAEMFMPLGKQNPKEAIKLNFNYPISDELQAKDIKIYEVTSVVGEDGSNTTKEVPISNTISLSKAYGGKQLVVTVGDGGLYYNKNYKLVINKNIIVEDYISLTEKEYEFSTYEYPDDLTAELTRSGDTISYNIAGGGESFCIMVSTYDAEGALVGLKCVNAQKEGSGNRQKARGSVGIVNSQQGDKVMVHIFTGDGTMQLYRMPTEF